MQEPWLGSDPGMPAEYPCPPLKCDRDCRTAGTGEKCQVNGHAKPRLTPETTADTPVRNQGPGRSLPGPDAGHPRQDAGGPAATWTWPPASRNSPRPSRMPWTRPRPAVPPPRSGSAWTVRLIRHSWPGCGSGPIPCSVSIMAGTSCGTAGLATSTPSGNCLPWLPPGTTPTAAAVRTWPRPGVPRPLAPRHHAPPRQHHPGMHTAVRHAPPFLVTSPHSGLPWLAARLQHRSGLQDSPLSCWAW